MVGPARCPLALAVALCALAAGASAPARAQGPGGGHGGDNAMPSTGLERSYSINAPSSAPAKPTLVPVPVQVLAVPFPIGNAVDAQVALLVEVSGPELLAGATDGSLEGTIAAAAVDAAGKTVDQLSQPFAL